jgi:ribosomal protein L16 Arg81 hydroxylase
VLEQWLESMSVAEFERLHLGRAPLARPCAARAAADCFQWDGLVRVLRAPELDVLVVRGGHERPLARPRDLVELRRLLAGGDGLVVRRAERHDAGLAALAALFAKDLPGRVHVQIFVTASDTNGFGWHYDEEEVFIVQTGGKKDYYFRRNSVAPPPPRTDAEPYRTDPPDFARVREEKTPIQTCTLWPGDWLYVPRGWWHVAKARTDSLSLSLGVTPGACAPAAEIAAP